MLYKVVLAFTCKSVDEVCDHSNESYSEQYFHVVLFNIYYAVQDGSDTVTLYKVVQSPGIKPYK